MFGLSIFVNITIADANETTTPIGIIILFNSSNTCFFPLKPAANNIPAAKRTIKMKAGDKVGAVGKVVKNFLKNP